MLFKEVIGQYAAKELIGRMVRTHRLPHAVLLLGTPGSGALPLAWASAQYLLCQNRGEEEACGQCPACQKVAKAIHPDLHFSFPTVGSKMTSDNFLPAWREALAATPYMEVNDWLQRIGAENKQGNIPKEECVQIVRKLSLKTYESPYKVLIMWLPEYLGNEGNRLLKLIEEPPEQTIFFLVAENQDQILNTILSRCQLIKADLLSDEDIISGLRARLSLSEELAAGVAQLSGGNFNEALHLAASAENDHATRFLDWMRACYKGRAVEMSRWVDGFAELGRENQKHFLRYALHFWREFLALKFAGDTAPIRLRQEELDTARRMLGLIGLAQLGEIVELLDECTYHVERNAHPKILFLDASIRIHHILQSRATKQASQTKAIA